MKKILFFIFFTSVLYSQSKGIAYQAVIVRPNVQTLPGVDIPSSPLINSDICLKFSFTDSSNNLEYQEVIKTITNQYGVVNVTIGKGTQIGGYASSFTAIAWNTTDKNLKVELDITSSCTSFELISEQSFSSAPFAFNAITANNVTGVVAIENGGTGATTAMEARTNLGLSNVDNTSDADKPVSTATQTELSLKENLSNKSTDVSLDGTSDEKYPSVKSIKNYVDTQINSKGSTGVVDATTSIKGKIQLAGDLTGTADAPTIADGAVTNAKIATGIDKSKVGLENVDNTSDADKPVSKAVQVELDKKLNTDLLGSSYGVAMLDANGKILSTQLSPVPLTKILVLDSESKMLSLDNPAIGTVVIRTDNSKNYILAYQDATLIDNWVELLTPNSPVQSVNGKVGVIQISKDDLFLNKVDNTADIDKPVSLATTTELDKKEDKSNKSTNILADSKSDDKYPSVKSVRTYVDTVISSGVPDATASIGGKIKLAGDLTGSADQPIIANGVVTTAKLANGVVTTDKVVDGAITNVKLARGIDKSKVGLENVDNTSDLSKPISTATQAELNAKAPLFSPTFRGTVSGITKSMVGLADVDNTSDANKPISTATQTALGLKENVSNKSTDVSVDGTSDEKYPSVKAIKNYVDTQIGTGVEDASSTVKGKIQLAGDLTGSADRPVIANGVVTNDKLANGIDKSKMGLSKVDNTSDADKPISIAAQSALNLKENVSNKSTDIVIDRNSNDKYPSVMAVKSYVDKQVIDNTVNATTLNKGVVQLAGDLSGTAEAPIIADGVVTNNKVATGIDRSKVGLSNVDNTSDLNKPISTATQNALDLKLDSNLLGVEGGIASLDSNGKIPSSQISPVSFSSVNVVNSEEEMLALQDLVVGSIVVRLDLNKNYILGGSDSSILSNWVELLTPDAPVQTVNGKTGTVLLTPNDISLGNVNNTSDLDKPVSNATQIALDAKENMQNKSNDISADATSSDKYPSVKAIKSYVDTQISASGNVDATNVVKGNIKLAGDLSGTADLPTIASGAITNDKVASGIDKSKVGLNNVDNTSDASKPISTATQKALDAKANLAAPTFTGTVTSEFFSGNGSKLTDIKANSTDNISVTQNVTGTTDFYPLFVSTTAGALKANVANKAGFSYIPSTGTLTAKAFSGSGANLTNISKINIGAIDNKNTGVFHPVFTDLNGNDKSLSIYKENLTYTPATGTLAAKMFSGDGSKITNIKTVQAKLFKEKQHYRLALVENLNINKPNGFETGLIAAVDSLAFDLDKTFGSVDVGVNGDEKYFTLNSPVFSGNGSELYDVPAAFIQAPTKVQNFPVPDKDGNLYLHLPFYSKSRFMMREQYDFKSRKYRNVSYHDLINLDTEGYNNVGRVDYNIANKTFYATNIAAEKFSGDGSLLTGVKTDLVNYRAGLDAPGGNSNSGILYPSFLQVVDYTKNGSSVLGFRDKVYYDTSSNTFGAPFFEGDGSKLTNIKSDTANRVSFVGSSVVEGKPNTVNIGYPLVFNPFNTLDDFQSKVVYDDTGNLLFFPSSGGFLSKGGITARNFESTSTAQSTIKNLKVTNLTVTKVTGLDAGDLLNLNATIINSTTKANVTLNGSQQYTLSSKIVGNYNFLRFKVKTTYTNDDSESSWFYIDLKADKTIRTYNFQFPIDYLSSDMISNYIFRVRYDSNTNILDIPYIYKKSFSVDSAGKAKITSTNLKAEKSVFISEMQLCR